MPPKKGSRKAGTKVNRRREKLAVDQHTDHHQTSEKPAVREESPIISASAEPNGDLILQQQAARATIIGTRVAIIALLLTFIGIVLGWYSDRIRPSIDSGLASTEVALALERYWLASTQTALATHIKNIEPSASSIVATRSALSTQSSNLQLTARSLATLVATSYGNQATRVASLGIRVDYFKVENPIVNAGEDIWYSFKIINYTDRSINLGGLGAVIPNRLSHNSWADFSFGPNAIIEWLDHVAINSPGAYTLYLFICDLPNQSTCASSPSSWTILSNGVAVTVR